MMAIIGRQDEDEGGRSLEMCALGILLLLVLLEFGKILMLRLGVGGATKKTFSLSLAYWIGMKIRCIFGI